MKKFINEHPKMYWFIVVALSILVFSIVTCVGLGKLERAEASVDVTVNLNQEIGTHTVYDLTELDWTTKYTGSFTAEQIISECTAYYVRKTGSLSLEYYFLKQPIYYNDTFIRQYNFWWNNGDFKVSVYCYDGIWCVTSVGNVSGWDVAYNSGANFILGSTYDYFANNTESSCDVLKERMPRNNLTYPKLYVVGYDSAVNRVKLESYKNTNKLFNNWKTPIDESVHELTWKFADVVNSSGFPYRLEQAYYIWLPSKDYVWDYYYTYLHEYDDGATIDISQISGKVGADVLAWQRKVGTDDTSVLYKLTRKREYPVDFDYSKADRNRFDYMDFHEMLETDDFEFREYYGFENISDSVWKEVRSFAFGHLYIPRVDNVLYECRSDGDFYNGLTTFTFLLDGTALETHIDGDALTDENLDETVEQEVNQSLKDLIGQLGNNVNDLQGQINNINGSLGSFDTEFEGVDLWEGIKGIGSGLIGLTGFLGNLAGVLGSVFAFLPYDVQQIAGYFFMASILIALWKLIKR